MRHAVPADFDPQRLAAFLRVLANPVRLEMLRSLARPQAIQDIRVSPHRAEAGARPERPMSAVAVRKHMDQLVAIGVVRTQRRMREGRLMGHFEVNLPQVFALSEEFLSMARIGGADGLADGTLLGPPSQALRQPDGPHLVLVRGLGEGRCFPLAEREGQAWTIGRAASSEVCLDYDGFVSLANTRLEYRDGAFVAHDIATNRNGTSVNWTMLPAGGRQELAPGDVLGVGRSRLLLRA